MLQLLNQCNNEWQGKCVPITNIIIFNSIVCKEFIFFLYKIQSSCSYHALITFMIMILLQPMDTLLYCSIKFSLLAACRIIYSNNVINGLIKLALVYQWVNFFAFTKIFTYPDLQQDVYCIHRHIAYKLQLLHASLPCHSSS